MTTFNELLDLTLSGVDVGLSLDHDPGVAEALRRIRATPDDELSFEPEVPDGLAPLAVRAKALPPKASPAEISRVRSR